MESLQDKIKTNLCVYISPSGINYSNFSRNKMRNSVYKNLWDDKANFGIILEDEQKRKTELIGCIRHFERKAQLKYPLTDFKLQDEKFNLSPLLKNYLFAFFHSLSGIKYPDTEESIHYKGEFKEVHIKRKVSHNNFWKKTFVDLYTENDSIIEKLDNMSKQSKIVLRENRFWKKYENVRKYIKTMQEKGYVIKNNPLGNILSNDPKEKNYFKGRNLLELLRKNPLFSPEFQKDDDYKYFLLGFYKTNFDIEDIHKKILFLFEEQNLLEKYIEEFTNKTSRLKIFSSNYLNLNNQYKIFGAQIDKEKLNKSYEEIIKDGKNIRTPATLSQELWDLGFFPLKRNRKMQPTKSSYALIKVHGTPSFYQKVLPFKEFENRIEMPEEDYTPDYSKRYEEDTLF